MEQLAGLLEDERKLALGKRQLRRLHMEEKRSLLLAVAEADISPRKTATMGCTGAAFALEIAVSGGYPCFQAHPDTISIQRSLPSAIRTLS